jgi:hypothetical protein
VAPVQEFRHSVPETAKSSSAAYAILYVAAANGKFNFKEETMHRRSFRRGAWLIGLILLIGCAAAPAFTPEVIGAPKLKVDKESIDLGDRKVGQPVSVSFEITNVGDQPLRFSEAPYIEVAAGC